MKAAVAPSKDLTGARSAINFPAMLLPTYSTCSGPASVADPAGLPCRQTGSEYRPGLFQAAVARSIQAAFS